METNNYEELVKKHSGKPEEKDQETAKQKAVKALRNKKNWLRGKVFTAIDATEEAKEKFELAVINTDKTAFDEEYLAYKTATETEKMYKELYESLFGKLPE